MAGSLAPHRGTGRTGQQFQHRGPRRAQRPSPAGRAAPGERGSRRSRVRAGYGPGVPGTPGDAASSPPAPSVYLLGQGHGPAAPLRACCGQALSAGGERNSEAEQPHHTRAAQATATLAAVHRRPRQPPLAPAPPGRLARSLLRCSSRGLGPVERARESRRPARARDWRREEATVTWPRDARRCRLGRARLCRRHTPGCPWSPDPTAPREHRPCPPHWPAHAPAPRLRRRKAWRSQSELSRRKGLVMGGWMGG